MSANNKLLIFEDKNGKWTINHIDLDCGLLSDRFPKFDTLEEAVGEANDWMSEHECEYGLDIIT